MARDSREWFSPEEARCPIPGSKLTSWYSSEVCARRNRFEVLLKNLQTRRRNGTHQRLPENPLICEDEFEEAVAVQRTIQELVIRLTQNLNHRLHLQH